MCGDRGAASVKSLGMPQNSSLSENQSWLKQFHVGQANLIRHMRMGGNDNSCLLKTQQHRIYVHIQQLYRVSVLEGIMS